MILYGTIFLYCSQSAPYLNVRHQRCSEKYNARGSLLLAVLIIAVLAMHQEDSEVTNVKVGDGSFEARGKRPRECHE